MPGCSEAPECVRTVRVAWTVRPRVCLAVSLGRSPAIPLQPPPRAGPRPQHRPPGLPSLSPWVAFLAEIMGAASLGGSGASGGGQDQDAGTLLVTCHQHAVTFVSLVMVTCLCMCVCVRARVCVCVCVYLLSFVFLGLNQWHMEIPRLGVESEL